MHEEFARKATQLKLNRALPWHLPFPLRRSATFSGKQSASRDIFLLSKSEANDSGSIVSGCHLVPWLPQKVAVFWDWTWKPHYTCVCFCREMSRISEFSLSSGWKKTKDFVPEVSLFIIWTSLLIWIEVWQLEEKETQFLSLFCPPQIFIKHCSHPHFAFSRSGNWSQDNAIMRLSQDIQKVQVTEG